jgi:hypothetical protein
MATVTRTHGLVWGYTPEKGGDQWSQLRSFTLGLVTFGLELDSDSSGRQAPGTDQLVTQYPVPSA